MSREQDNINLVSDRIDTSIDKLIEGIDKSQRGILNRSYAIIKELELDAQGNIKQTVKNLRLLGKIRLQLKNSLLTDSYKTRVQRFLNTYPRVQKDNELYFKAITESFNPTKELYREVLRSSVTATQESLLGAGIDENVINPTIQVVRNAVSGNSSYSDLTKELRVLIEGDEEVLGGLMRYSKQIATDGINQFNANYNNSVAQDLGLEWYYYAGSKRKTSRPFCKKYAGKYFHKKEVEDFGNRKDLDGSNLCGGPSKSNLCAGRVKGTNKSNIFFIITSNYSYS